MDDYCENSIFCEEAREERDRLKAELERLRAALIVCGSMSGDIRWVRNYDEACAELQRRAAIAQAALANQQQARGREPVSLRGIDGRL